MGGVESGVMIPQKRYFVFTVYRRTFVRDAAAGRVWEAGVPGGELPPSDECEFWVADAPIGDAFTEGKRGDDLGYMS